jgi:hypothetical protein
MNSINNTKEYQSLIEINNLRLEYYKKNPELILDSTDWRSVAVCAFCYHEIPLDHLSLRSSFRDPRYQNHKDCYIPKCPGCNYSPTDSTYLKCGTTVYSKIPYLVIRSRSHIIEKNIKKNFFGKVVETSIKKIDEIEILEDHSKI